MTNENRDAGRFSLKQKKFYDGSHVVVHTANMSVLFGTIINHKKSRYSNTGAQRCWKLLIEIPILEESDINGDEGATEDRLLLDSKG
jgi:hypothetical protein